MRAPLTAVKAARGAEHASEERRAGTPDVAQNAAATGAVAHVRNGPHQRGSVARSLHRGRGSRHRLDGLASPGAAGRSPRLACGSFIYGPSPLSSRSVCLYAQPSDDLLTDR